jgi:hypothetical protein
MISKADVYLRFPRHCAQRMLSAFRRGEPILNHAATSTCSYLQQALKDSISLAILSLGCYTLTPALFQRPRKEGLHEQYIAL